jgi:hypothetical protein
MRGLRVSLLAACAFAALALPAFADDGWGGGVQVMQDDEMNNLRGGFAVEGINIDFGAVVTTYVDGTPVMTTNLTWTDVGAVVDQTIGQVGQNIADLSPAQRQALGIDGLNGANGVVITDASGITALVQNVTNGALQNIVINTATGREISQSTDITLTLPGFEVIQNALDAERVGIHLSDDMATMMTLGPHG